MSTPTAWKDIPNPCYVCGAKVQTRDLPNAASGHPDIEFRCANGHGFTAVAMPPSHPIDKTVEASSLGWAPGFCPAAFDYEGIKYTRMRTNRASDDIISWTYLGTEGTRLTVLND